MKTIEAPDRAAYKHLDTPALRQGFVLENLFAPGQANLAYTNVDRAVVGGIVPTAAPLALAGGREMACEHFHDRRESGIINLGVIGAATLTPIMGMVVDTPALGVGVAICMMFIYYAYVLWFCNWGSKVGLSKN